MSSTNKTSLGLNMWEASDKPVRQDFVNDNTIIDDKVTQLSSKLDNVNSNLNNKANNSDVIDKARLTGTVSTATDANSLFGYSGDANISLLSGYPSGKEIVAVVPVIAYSNTNPGMIINPATTTVRVNAKIAATFTYVVDVLYKRG